MCACGRVDNTFVAALHTYGFDGCIQFYVERCHEVGFGLDEQAVARAAKGYALLHCILQFALTFEHDVLRKVLLPLEEVGKEALEVGFVVGSLLVILQAEGIELFLHLRVFRHRGEQGIVVEAAVLDGALCAHGQGCQGEEEKENVAFHRG